jgi:hypothetical protein
MAIEDGCFPVTKSTVFLPNFGRPSRAAPVPREGVTTTVIAIRPQERQAEGTKPAKLRSEPRNRGG